MVFFVIAFCFTWGFYCGILTHLFEQPRKADAVASLIGFVIIVLASSQ